jgi:MATE family multidrug resistance protein
VHLLGLGGAVAELARAYLGRVYLLALPIAVAPLLDSFFIAMGNSRIPLLLQVIAVTSNLVLDRVLILGWGPVPAHGIAGAAEASAASRLVSSLVGLAILRHAYGVRLWPKAGGWRWSEVAPIVNTGLPAMSSVIAYASVYWVLLRLVISPLGRDVQAGLGIGFTAFEGFSFPFYLGTAMAGASLVGRELGRGTPERAIEVVHAARRAGRCLGLAFLLLFYLGAPVLVPLFSHDAGVVRESVIYVRTLAFSQYFVAAESVNEKVLLGAGRTRTIFCISVPGNVLRIPLAWLLALHAGFGSAGVWWAVNLTSLLKSTAFYWAVESRRWLAARGTGPSAADVAATDPEGDPRTRRGRAPAAREHTSSKRSSNP